MKLFDLAWSCSDLCTMYLRSHCTNPGSFFPKENYLNLNNILFHVAFYCYPTVRTTCFFLYRPDVYIVLNSFYCSILLLGMVMHDNEFETMEK